MSTLTDPCFCTNLILVFSAHVTFLPCRNACSESRLLSEPGWSHADSSNAITRLSIQPHKHFAIYLTLAALRVEISNSVERIWYYVEQGCRVDVGNIKVVRNWSRNIHLVTRRTSDVTEIQLRLSSFNVVCRLNACWCLCKGKHWL